jgi:hypothetical protein
VALAVSKPSGIRVVKPGKKIKLLVYGLPGSGKSVLAGTSPRCLILRPPTDHLDSLPADTDVEEWVLNDWDDMNEAMEYLRHEGGKDYDWVWIDSISLLQDHTLDHVWADAVARKPDRAKFGVDKGEYGINMTRLGSWFRHVVGGDQFNFGVTAHPFETTDLESEPVMMPWVQGRQMAEKICGYMNCVGRLYVAEKKDGTPYRVLETEHKGLYWAKDQLGIGRMVEPTIPKIMSKVAAAKTPTKTASRSVRRRVA